MGEGAPAEKQEQAKGFFTVIRRGDNRRATHRSYSMKLIATALAKAAQLLREAASSRPTRL